MSINSYMTTSFVLRLFPHTVGTLIMDGTGLAQQKAENVKNDSVYVNCSSIHSPLSSVQISDIATQ